MFTSDSRTHGGIGMVPMQHHKHLPSWRPDQRASVWGYRVTGYDEKLIKWIIDPESYGDWIGQVLWKKDKRESAAWSWLFGVVTTAGERSGSTGFDPGNANAGLAVYPLSNDAKDKDGNQLVEAKPAFKTANPKTPKRKFRDLWETMHQERFGVLLAATNVNEQVDIFMPTDPRLVCVNFQGEAGMSRLVCDLDNKKRVDQDRRAPIHSCLRVIKWPDAEGAGFGEKTAHLALNFAGGAQDKAGPGGLVYDLPNAGASGSPGAAGGGLASRLGSLASGGALGSAGAGAFGPSGSGGAGGAGEGPGAGGQRALLPGFGGSSGAARGAIALLSVRQGGFIDVGGLDDLHKLGQDADGNLMMPAHIGTGGLYRMDHDHDGPIAFTSEFFVKPKSPDQGSEGLFQFDPTEEYQLPGVKRKFKGKWKIKVKPAFVYGRITYSAGSGPGPFTYGVKPVSKTKPTGTSAGPNQGTTGFGVATPATKQVDARNMYEAAATGYFNPLPVNTLVLLFAFDVGKRDPEYWFAPAFPGSKVTDGSTEVSNVTKYQFAGTGGSTVTAAKTADGHVTVTIDSSASPGSLEVIQVNANTPDVTGVGLINIFTLDPDAIGRGELDLTDEGGGEVTIRSRQPVRKNGSGTEVVRRCINFNEDNGIAITLADNPGSEWADVTFTFDGDTTDFDNTVSPVETKGVDGNAATTAYEIRETRHGLVKSSDAFAQITPGFVYASSNGVTLNKKLNYNADGRITGVTDP